MRGRFVIITICVLMLLSGCGDRKKDESNNVMDKVIESKNELDKVNTKNNVVISDIKIRNISDKKRKFINEINKSTDTLNEENFHGFPTFEIEMKIKNNNDHLCVIFPSVSVDFQLKDGYGDIKTNTINLEGGFTIQNFILQVSGCLSGATLMGNEEKIVRWYFSDQQIDFDSNLGVDLDKLVDNPDELTDDTYFISNVRLKNYLVSRDDSGYSFLNTNVIKDYSCMILKNIDGNMVTNDLYGNGNVVIDSGKIINNTGKKWRHATVILYPCVNNIPITSIGKIKLHYEYINSGATLELKNFTKVDIDGDAISDYENLKSINIDDNYAYSEGFDLIPVFVTYQEDEN